MCIHQFRFHVEPANVYNCSRLYGAVDLLTFVRHRMEMHRSALYAVHVQLQLGRNTIIIITHSRPTIRIRIVAGYYAAGSSARHNISIITAA